jgi:hypothetical protein
MKKLTLTFLTLFMVMPSLVCGMTLCPMQSAQAAEVGADKPVPCHEQSQEDTDSGVMLMQECMGVDLQKSDAAQIGAPDLTIDFVVYAPFIEVLANQFSQIDSNAIRGPPLQPDIVALSAPIYHTTQRFRI